MFLHSFKDLIPLILQQWYVHHIHRVIRLGLLEPYPWFITRISTTDSQNDFTFAGEKLKKKAKKGESATLIPSTRVCVSFSHYRVVICLDISESSFSSTSSLADAMLSILAEISANTRSNRRIVGVHISIIAHLPEIDETWSIWQGEICSQSDINLLQSLIRSRVDRIEEQSIKAKATALQVATRTNFFRFPDSETFLKAILFHLKLLPGEACPKAILLTGGSMTIRTGPTALINQFSKHLISLNVLIDTAPCSPSVGFYADSCGLKLLAAQTVGGSVDILPNSSQAAINDVCRQFIGHSFFTFLAFGCNSIAGKSRTNSNSADISSTQHGVHNRLQSFATPEEQVTKHNMRDVIIKSYTCEGATVEHLLSMRLCEGFRILNLSQERENMLSIHATQSGPVFAGQIPKGAIKKMPFMTYNRYEQQQQQQQPVSYMLVIRLEKMVSKLLTLVYQVSYKKGGRRGLQQSSLLGSKSPLSQLYSHALSTTPKGSQVQGSKTHVKQSWEKAVAGEAVSAEELEKLFDVVR